jgi:hypothetical protein
LAAEAESTAAPPAANAELATEEDPEEKQS